MGSTVRHVCVVTLLMLGAAEFAAAQVELGAITGTVKDAHGGVLPGVTAAAINTATNVTTTAITNPDGMYLLNALVNGTYRVTYTIAGFSPSARDLELRAGDRLRVDMTLEVGALTEELRVVAETPLRTTRHPSPRPETRSMPGSIQARWRSCATPARRRVCRAISKVDSRSPTAGSTRGTSTTSARGSASRGTRPKSRSSEAATG